MTTQLSPTAQAVLDAVLAQWNVYAVDDARWAIAAALRAAAEHLKTIGPWAGHLESSALNWAILEIESIAAELEGADG